jgi:putative salt-induced outer membrane protein YdiY
MPRILFLCLAAIAVTQTLFPVCCQAQLDYDFDPGVVEEVIVEDVVPVWTGTVAAGLNGKTGNSQTTDMNLEVNLSRESERAVTTLLANYFYSENNIATVTDRAFAQFRQERKLAHPKWSWYYQAGFEWDQFKDFDYRVSLHSGLAYLLYELEDRFLKLRFGGGASKEVGSVNDDWSPELQFGADWERKLSAKTRLYATLDFFPNVSDFSDYRMNTNTGMDFLLDGERNINFRIFALSLFDSTPPPGNTRNDLSYGAALVVGF